MTTNNIWIDVSFSKKELDFLEKVTENLGHKYGQIGTDLHERFSLAASYARECKRN